MNNTTDSASMNNTINLVDTKYSWKNMTLFQYLDEGNTPSGWLEFFGLPDVKKQIAMISKELEAEQADIYPPINRVFRAFYMVPLNQVKVVLLGQDPYPNPGSAVGLCFSVGAGNSINSSLLNIYEELENEGYRVNRTGNLTHWARQGVLMLNTALTVRHGEPESHSCAWYMFTNLLIKYIHSKRGNQVKWLLFGSQAYTIVSKNIGKNSNMYSTSHPSPLSAHTTTRFGPAFIGSGVFRNIPEIEW